MKLLSLLFIAPNEAGEWVSERRERREMIVDAQFADMTEWQYWCYLCKLPQGRKEKTTARPRELLLFLASSCLAVGQSSKAYQKPSWLLFPCPDRDLLLAGAGVCLTIKKQKKNTALCTTQKSQETKPKAERKKERYRECGCAVGMCWRSKVQYW